MEVRSGEGDLPSHLCKVLGGAEGGDRDEEEGMDAVRFEVALPVAGLGSTEKLQLVSV